MKKSICLVLTAILSVSLLAGCGSKTSTDSSSSSSSTSTTTSADKLKGKITFITHRTDKVDVIQGIAKDFMALHPGAEITVEPNPGDDVMKTRIAANELPDIMLIPAGLGITREKYADYFLPIDDLGFTKDNMNFYDGGVGPDNKLYTLSITVNYNGVVYNKKVFKDAGITTTPKTEEEFLADCALIKAKGVVPVASNFKDKWPLGSFGDGAMQADIIGVPNYKNTLIKTDKYYNDDKGGMLYGLNFLRNLSTKGFLEKDLMSTNWDGSKKDIATGKVAMMFLGTWFPSQAIDAGMSKDEVGMFPVPGAKALVFGPDIFYAVTKNSKSPELAKAFFKYMWKDGLMPTKVGMIPPNKDAKIDSPFVSELLGSKLPLVQGDVDSADYQALINKAQIDAGTVTQEFVTAKSDKDAQAVADKYNKKWADAKKSLGK